MNVWLARLGEIQDTVSAVTKSIHLTFRTREGPVRASPLSSSNFHEAAVKTLVGEIVLTRYNNKTYCIDGIDWERNPSFQFEGNVKTNGPQGRETTYKWTITTSSSDKQVFPTENPLYLRVVCGLVVIYTKNFWGPGGGTFFLEGIESTVNQRVEYVNLVREKKAKLSMPSKKKVSGPQVHRYCVMLCYRWKCCQVAKPTTTCL